MELSVRSNLGTCYNTPGSFHCKCPTGMEGTGRRSVGGKVDEETTSNTENDDSQTDGTNTDTSEEADTTENGQIVGADTGSSQTGDTATGNSDTGGSDSGATGDTTDSTGATGDTTDSTATGETQPQVGQINDDDLFDGTGIGRRRRREAVDTGCTDLA